MFSQPGKSLIRLKRPSFSSLSPHLALFSRRREQLLIPKKQQPTLKSVHPSTLWDSKYFSVRHLSVNYFTVAPTSRLMGAKPSWPELSIAGRESRKQVLALPEGLTSPRFSHITCCYHPPLYSRARHPHHPPPDTCVCKDTLRYTRNSEFWPFTHSQLLSHLIASHLDPLISSWMLKCSLSLKLKLHGFI